MAIYSLDEMVLFFRNSIDRSIGRTHRTGELLPQLLLSGGLSHIHHRRSCASTCTAVIIRKHSAFIYHLFVGHHNITLDLCKITVRISGICRQEVHQSSFYSSARNYQYFKSIWTNYLQLNYHLLVSWRLVVASPTCPLHSTHISWCHSNSSLLSIFATTDASPFSLVMTCMSLKKILLSCITYIMSTVGSSRESPTSRADCRYFRAAILRSDSAFIH